MAANEFSVPYNAGGVWWVAAGSLANRPAPGIPGRLYLVSEVAERTWTQDTGASWEPVGSSEAASSVLQKLLTVDGPGSGLNADLLDGLDSTDFARVNDTRIPTQGENDALVGTSGVPGTANPYINTTDPRVPTQGENDALVGNRGTPSSANRYVTEADKNVAGGVAGLDPVTGKFFTGQIPDTILGTVDYQGAWNASTNTPTLDALGTGRSKGDYFVVSVGGSTNLAGKTDWEPKDWIVWNGSAWEFVDNTDSVTSVFGRRGPILAQAGDYRADQVTNTPAGNIAATTVQAAINELDAEKASATDARLRVIRDEGISLANRPALDFTGAGVIVTDDGAGGRTQVNISGAAAGQATEAAAGVGEISTQAEVDARTDDSRIVTPLKLANRKAVGAFRAFANVNQGPIASSTFTKVNFPNEHYDRDGWYDAPNSRYLPPAGIYDFKAGVEMNGSSAGSYLFLMLYKGTVGAAPVRYADMLVATNATSGAFGGSGPGELELNGNEFVEIWIWHNSTATNSIFGGDTAPARVWFAGSMKGA